jgi:hypothetical protein
VFGNYVGAENTSFELTCVQDHLSRIFALLLALILCCPTHIARHRCPDYEWEGVAFVSAISTVNVRRDKNNDNTTITTTTNNNS